MFVVTSLLAASLLGALYYGTATRQYEARTSLMLMYQGSDERGPGMDGYRQTMLPTYERLIFKSVVLEDAANRLRDVAIEQRAELANKPFEEWVNILRANLSARAIRSTNFVEVSYRSIEPEAAVTIINSIVQSYLRFIELNQRNSATESVLMLDRGRADVADQIANKQRELLVARRQVGDLGLRDGARVTHPLVHNVIRINEALREVRHERLRLESSLAALRDAIANGRDLRHFVVSADDTNGRDTMLGMLGLSQKDQQAVQQLQLELSEAQNQLQTFEQFYGDAHPNVVELRDSIARKQAYLIDYREEKNRRLAEQENRSLGRMLQATISGKLSTAIAHEKKLTGEYDVAQKRAIDLNGRVAQVAILEQDLKMLRELHDTLRNQIANLDIRQERAEIRMAVVSEPKPDDSPVSPSLVSVLLAVVGIGSAAGIAAAYVADVLDDRFRSVDELRDQLRVTVLSIVRQLPVFNATGVDSLQVHISPQAVESEAFRTLRASLAFSDAVGECIAVSSSEPGDGKTTVLSNLGVASTQAGKRTLLIDADMRRPGLTRLFGLRGHLGLANVLQDSLNVNDSMAAAICSTGLNDLDVVPSGPPPTDPSGLLAQDRFSAVVDWACSQYDQVLIDTPPILAASDASVVGRLTNGVVLVVDPAKNHRRLVHRAVDEIRNAALDVVGVVVNRVSNRSDDGYGYSYGYGQGYGHGYHDQGSDDDMAIDSPTVEAGSSELDDSESTVESLTIPVRAPDNDREAIRPRRAA